MRVTVDSKDIQALETRVEELATLLTAVVATHGPVVVLDTLVFPGVVRLDTVDGQHVLTYEEPEED